MKKLLAFVLMFCMISTFKIPAAGAAPIAELLGEDGKVEKTYDTVDEIIEEGVNGKTLRLLDNITIPFSDVDDPFLVIVNGATLDLNGKTLTIQIDIETIPEGRGIIGIYVRGNEDGATIKNGTIKMHVTEKVNNGAISVIGRMGYPLNMTNVEMLYSSDSEAVISPVAIHSSLEQGAGDVTLENCVFDMGGPLTFEFVPYLGQNHPDKAVLVSGSYVGLDKNDDRIEIRGTEMAALPEGVYEDTTVITAPETTAYMVKAGRAYLYDSLQGAVDAAENFGAEPRIALVKATNEEVTLETGANFTLVQSETAQFTGSFVAAETGYEVNVEGDKVSVQAAPTPGPTTPTEPEKPQPEKPAHTPVRDTVTVEIGGEKPQAPAEENPNTGAPVLTGVVTGVLAAVH